MAFLFADDVNSKELQHDGAKKEIFFEEQIQCECVA